MEISKCQNIAIIGASGAIGQALTKNLAKRAPTARICAFSRSAITYKQANVEPYQIDFTNEKSIAEAAGISSKTGKLDIVLITIGVLHDADLLPEKSLRDISLDKFSHVFAVNTFLPAIVAKYFLPTLHTDNKSIFCALSARVGSISDNQLGGWYAYRASKAALNMILKTAALEMRIRNKKAIVTGLHPGTVDSNLSKPFQSNIKKDQLFTADFAATKLIEVIEGLSAEDSGKCLAWDGKEIPP